MIKISVEFKNREILIDGKPTYLFSGEIQSFRIPCDQWRDRLEKIKAMGLNCIGLYIPWNFHSNAPGQTDFTSPQRDIGKFLDLARDIGLYVFVRPGPYICNEWDLGGYPGWLLYEKSGDWRTGDPEHLKWLRKWYKDVDKFIASRQQTKGGPIVLYQVENEHFWGDKELFKGLAMQALEDGIEVPFISNGGGCVYLSEDKYIADGPDIYIPIYDEWSRKSGFDWYYHNLPKDAPIMVPEYAGGTFCVWGDTKADEIKYPSEWLKFLTGMLMGKGANLTNIFVATAGVTPCGYASDHSSTNYYEDAAISLWGGLGTKFYIMRLWTEAVSSVNTLFSTSKPWDIGLGTNNKNVECLARKSTDGNFYFALNNTLKQEEYKIVLPELSNLPEDGVCRIKPKTAQFLMGNLKLTDRTKLDFCSTQILKIWNEDNSVNIVTYDEDGNEGCVFLTSGGKKNKLSYICSDDVNVYVLPCGDIKIKVYAISEKLAEKTWFANNEKKTVPLFTNIDLIRQAKDRNGNLRAEVSAGNTVQITTDYSDALVINNDEIKGKAVGNGLFKFDFDVSGKEAINKTEFTMDTPEYKAESGSWHTAIVDDMSGWRKIRPFDGISDSLIETGYYRYRTDFEVLGELPSIIEFTGITGVESEFFLNGQKLGVFPLKRPDGYHALKELSVSFNVEGIIKKGTNKLAVASNLIGRHNAGKPIYAGINCPAVLYSHKDEIYLTKWKESPYEAKWYGMKWLKEIPEQALPYFDDSEWKNISIAKDNDNKGYEFSAWHDVRWYRTKYTLQDEMRGKPLLLKLPKTTEAWVYVEGYLAGMINEHQSTTIDITDFSNKKEINIAIALRDQKWGGRPWQLTDAPVLFTADQILKDDWYILKGSEGERNRWIDNDEAWDNEYQDKTETRLWYKRKIAVKRPKNLIAPVYVELDDNWKTHATIYWNGYPLGMYASIGPDRRFYVQDNIIKDVNTLIIKVDGYNHPAQCGNLSLGVYAEHIPLKIRL